MTSTPRARSNSTVPSVDPESIAIISKTNDTRCRQTPSSSAGNVAAPFSVGITIETFGGRHRAIPCSALRRQHARHTARPSRGRLRRSTSPPAASTRTPADIAGLSISDCSACASAADEPASYSSPLTPSVDQIGDAADPRADHRHAGHERLVDHERRVLEPDRAARRARRSVRRSTPSSRSSNAPAKTTGRPSCLRAKTRRRIPGRWPRSPKILQLLLAGGSARTASSSTWTPLCQTIVPTKPIRSGESGPRRGRAIAASIARKPLSETSQLRLRHTQTHGTRWQEKTTARRKDRCRRRDAGQRPRRASMSLRRDRRPPDAAHVTAPAARAASRRRSAARPQGRALQQPRRRADRHLRGNGDSPKQRAQRSTSIVVADVPIGAMQRAARPTRTRACSRAASRRRGMPAARASAGSSNERFSRLWTWTTSGWMARSTEAMRSPISGDR